MNTYYKISFESYLKKKFSKYEGKLNNEDTLTQFIDDMLRDKHITKFFCKPDYSVVRNATNQHE